MWRLCGLLLGWSAGPKQTNDFISQSLGCSVGLHSPKVSAHAHLVHLRPLPGAGLRNRGSDGNCCLEVVFLTNREHALCGT
eukprot:4245835-Amphidinium_carterae.1